MAIYLHAYGSAFEEILNGYMRFGQGVNPYNPQNIPFQETQGIMYNNVTLPSTLLSGAENATAGVPGIKETSLLQPAPVAGLAGQETQPTPAMGSGHRFGIARDPSIGIGKP